MADKTVTDLAEDKRKEEALRLEIETSVLRKAAQWISGLTQEAEGRSGRSMVSEIALRLPNREWDDKRE